MLGNINIGRVARWLPHAFIETRASADHIMLTFDDGPYNHVLPDLLNLLAAYNVKATFFCIGSRMRDHPALVRDILSGGHVLGNHSFTHDSFFLQSTESQLKEIEMTEDLIVSSGGKGKLFRPPEGKIDLKLALELKRKKFRIVYWNFDSLDYSKNLVKISNKFLSRPVSQGDIILMHDDHVLCCEVLKEWLPRWLDQGLQFGTL